MDNLIGITDRNTNSSQKSDLYITNEDHMRLKPAASPGSFKFNYPFSNLTVRSEREPSLFEVLVSRFFDMCSIRPVIENIIAIILAIGGICALNLFLNHGNFSGFKIYLQYIIEISAGLQILKSAKRSVILPLAAIVSRAIFANSPQIGNQFPHLSSSFYEAVLAFGILGITISVFSIE